VMPTIVARAAVFIGKQIHQKLVGCVSPSRWQSSLRVACCRDYE
jgi:hypothetical protein